jgi:hypothetical protein
MNIAICLSGSIRKIEHSLETIKDILKFGNIKLFIHTWEFENQDNLKSQQIAQQEDDFALTSSGYIWTYPNKNLTSSSIIVDLDKNWRSKNYDCFAVCVDFL